MKYTGFLKEYDSSLTDITLNDIKGNISINSQTLESILHYLESGILVFAWMHLPKDVETQEIIKEGHGIVTDGEWVWATYFPYYLRRYSNYVIDPEFLQYLEGKGYQYTTENSLVDTGLIESEFIQKLTSKAKENNL